MANRHEEGCSSSNVMKEMQIKAVMTPHYITGMAKIPNIDNTKSGGCEAVDTHSLLEGMQNVMVSLEDSLSFLRKLNILLL